MASHTLYLPLNELSKLTISSVSSTRPSTSRLHPHLRFYPRHCALQMFITGPPNKPVLFCSLASVVCRRRLSSSVTLPASGPAVGRVGGRQTPGRARGPTQHGGPVQLRPVRATRCLYLYGRPTSLPHAVEMRRMCRRRW